VDRATRGTRQTHKLAKEVDSPFRGTRYREWQNQENGRIGSEGASGRHIRRRKDKDMF